ncbi:AfsR/SARP family transcriptional regulator [Conexibacter woesei]|uniref:Transcriptional regulator, SARP family n=1 Tax=Conexibacter woesei (strain DSM 14684 / CCUG 47730 / CIP 108061 / JCM 11494 / NBRC 100937 / ID131577) TaxID=469383 RepID=D3FC87_CONWI|nr:BTAD domain-containing putative transcriptional regulator [Conexibacter woesei]ADB53382.1 transcriptional regulator, SARP family [Conexibacter woesei DSM 14684]
MTGVMVQGRATAAPAQHETTQTQTRDEPLRLTLLGGFELRHGGEQVELPASAQRLVAFLAIRARPLQRLHVAGSLWLDAPEERANAALRTALWRSRRRGCPLVDARGPSIGLAPGVEVDLHASARLARTVLESPPRKIVELAGLDHVWANGELLPDWYDDWVLIERERHRQLRLHALEALCEALTVAGRHGEAIEAGIAAVASEPLRESAHRVLICVHLAEGNVAEALRQYRLFGELLRDQLGLDPSARLRELIERAVTLR